MGVFSPSERNKCYKRTPYRAWVNQPSTLQEYHKYHGKVGIAVEELKGDMVTLYFTEGNSLSIYIPKACISPSNKGY